MSFFGQQNNQQQGTGFGGFGSNNNATSGGKSFSIDIALVKDSISGTKFAVDSSLWLSKGRSLTWPRCPSRLWPAASDKWKRAFRRHHKYNWRWLWGFRLRRYVSRGFAVSRISLLPTSLLSKHWQEWKVTISTRLKAFFRLSTLDILPMLFHTSSF